MSGLHFGYKRQLGSEHPMQAIGSALGTPRNPPTVISSRSTAGLLACGYALSDQTKLTGPVREGRGVRVLRQARSRGDGPFDYCLHKEGLSSLLT